MATRANETGIEYRVFYPTGDPYTGRNARATFNLSHAAGIAQVIGGWIEPIL